MLSFLQIAALPSQALPPDSAESPTSDSPVGAKASAPATAIAATTAVLVHMISEKMNLTSFASEPNQNCLVGPKDRRSN